MKLSLVGLTVPLVTGVALAGCATSAEDAEGPAVVADDLTASSRAIETGAVLAIARGAPADLLARPVAQGGIGLRTDATSALVTYRNGADGQAGTADDGALDTLAQLEAVPYVASVAIGRLRDFAGKQQVWRYLPADPAQGITLAALLASEKPVTRTASANSRTVPTDCRLPFYSLTVRVSIRLGALSAPPLFAFEDGTGLVAKSDIPIVFDRPESKDNYEEGAEFGPMAHFGTTTPLLSATGLQLDPAYQHRRSMFGPVVTQIANLSSTIDHGQLGFRIDTEYKQSGLYDHPGYCKVFVRTMSFDSATEAPVP